VKGQLTGADGISKSGVLVQLGSAKYLTDANGNFTFNNVKPDKYTLNLVRSSMAMGITPTIQVPLELSVKADSTAKVVIPLSKSGNLIGKIIYEKSTQVGVKEQAPLQVGILLKLYNERESFLTTPDEYGSFSFKEIIPGDWTLTATLLDKNEKVNIVQPKKVVKVVAEQSQQVSFTINPIVRNVRFSEKPILISSQ
jgi:hypothetical protein